MKRERTRGVMGGGFGEAAEMAPWTWGSGGGEGNTAGGVEGPAGRSSEIRNIMGKGNKKSCVRGVAGRKKKAHGEEATVKRKLDVNGGAGAKEECIIQNTKCHPLEV